MGRKKKVVAHVKAAHGTNARVLGDEKFDQESRFGKYFYKYNIQIQLCAEGKVEIGLDTVSFYQLWITNFNEWKNQH